MSHTTPAQRGSETVSLTDEAGVRRILVDTVYSLWGIVNNLTPLIFVGDMWSELVDWARRWMLRPDFELVNSEDMTIPRCVKGVDQTIAILKEHHARWQLANPSTSRSPDPA